MSARTRAGHAVAALVTFEPLGVDPPGALVGVGAVEQDDALGIGAVRQQPQQIALGAARLGEDDGLLLGAQGLGLGEGDAEGLEQGLALGVVIDRGREPGEGVEVGDLSLQRGTLGLAQGLGRVVLAPLLGRLVQRLVILVQCVF